ncbi:uncharacterized protein N0V89_001327 [Didymosphaeria variabile]|uniref:AB hydrolase-1 domain-containing protein n=1 Tax=Didymosphaeria variabile TaxID=1932322 RepID=A0A9W8XXW7_9PLEO|nr:uncharacterized protein N0V89_001327 [Didymosphaeria variabile]KAJ4360760.1 hypothetical protein N0V89_001327 [Didymosphaeria variabile]
MLGQLLWKCFSFVYASANLLAVLILAAVRDGAFFKRPSKDAVRELQIGILEIQSFDDSELRDRSSETVVKTESLLRKDSPQFPQDGPSQPQNVAVFIHGFPDSYLLWKKTLGASSLDSQTLIAVDLPGYGGSEGIETYSANDVLEAMTEFILGMREKYLKDQAKMVVVTHDWGAVIGARLAAEASQLADRWVIASVLIPELAYSNTTAKAASAKQMLHTYLRQPLRVSLLKNASRTLEPVVSQMRRSFYVFIFNLPWPLAPIFPTFGNYWFLRLLHKAGIGRIAPGKYRKLTSKEAGDAMASSAGPGLAQLDEPNGYATSLKKRLSNNGMLEKVRIYREGLFRGPWEKSIETVVALSEIQSDGKRGSGGSRAGLFDDGPPGALKAPATIVYGADDPAFESRLALDGIADYLAKDSQVVVLEESGHWLPLEELGSSAIEEVVGWAMGGEQGALKERFAGKWKENVRFRTQV